MAEPEPPAMEFETLAVHAGREEAFASMPIYMAATARDFYTRGGNPTIAALEKAAAALEGARRATAAACGMSAVTGTLLALLKSGDRVVHHRCLYDWTDTFFREEAPRLGITAVPVDFRDETALRDALGQPTRLVYFEPVSNPMIDVIDVEQTVRLAHRAGALAVVDNTFLTPALLRPLALGADVVVHSATKFLSGHGDALGGLALANDETIIASLRRARNIYGGVISPFNAFLILRGLATLPLRIARHGENAIAIARFLASHPKVASVRYPGLPTDPGHPLAARQFAGFGGMLGFVLKAGQSAAEAFPKSLALCKPWVSLGDIETLLYVRHPDPARGIPQAYIRLSAGLENPKDIIADLAQALNGVP